MKTKKTYLALYIKNGRALSKDGHLKLKDVEGNVYEWNIIPATFRA